MASIDEQVLRTAKEIIVKFIETGRVSPAGFSETFGSIYRAIDATVKESAQAGGGADSGLQPADGAPEKGRKPKASKK